MEINAFAPAYAKIARQSETLKVQNAGTTKRVAILGAAGRDFHNFNMLYRDDAAAEVVAFTATQIPGIAGRRYPAALAGPRYPTGIPIVDTVELEELVRRRPPSVDS
jgi:predicted GTPase